MARKPAAPAPTTSPSDMALTALIRAFDADFTRDVPLEVYHGIYDATARDRWFGLGFALDGQPLDGQPLNGVYAVEGAAWSYQFVAGRFCTARQSVPEGVAMIVVPAEPLTDPA